MSHVHALSLACPAICATERLRTSHASEAQNRQQRVAAGHRKAGGTVAAAALCLFLAPACGASNDVGKDSRR